MSKNVKINGTTYSGVSSVSLPLADGSGNVLFRENSEVINTPTASLSVTANGTYNVTNYASAVVSVASSSSVTLQEKSVTPSTSAQTVTADSGYTGLSSVTVAAIQTQAKSVTPSTSVQTVTADSGKYLSQVTVAAASGSPALTSLSVTPTTMTVANGSTSDAVKSGLTAMSGTYTLSGYTGTLSADLTAYISSAAVSGTMPTAGNTAAMTVSYGGQSTVVSVTMDATAPTLTGLSATYTDGAVTAGTTLSQLTETVKATYSDGTTSAALIKGTDYTLSGTLTAGQANTVTVTGAGTYAGLSATFLVTVKAVQTAVTSATVYIYPSDYDEATYGAKQSPSITTDRANANGWNVLGSGTPASGVGTHGATGDWTFTAPLTVTPKTIKITRISTEDVPTAANAAYDGVWTFGEDATTATGTAKTLASETSHSLTVSSGDIAWIMSGSNYAGISLFTSDSTSTVYFGKLCPHGVVVEVSG